MTEIKLKTIGNQRQYVCFVLEGVLSEDHLYDSRFSDFEISDFRDIENLAGFQIYHGDSAENDRKPTPVRLLCFRRGFIGRSFIRFKSFCF